jgi:hypothetical protein
MYCYVSILTKMGSATFWAIFSETHLVTLNGKKKWNHIAAAKNHFNLNGARMAAKTCITIRPVAESRRGRSRRAGSRACSGRAASASSLSTASRSTPGADIMIFEMLPQKNWAKKLAF